MRGVAVLIRYIFKLRSPEFPKKEKKGKKGKEGQKSKAKPNPRCLGLRQVPG